MAGPKDVLDAANVSVKSELLGVGQHLMGYLVNYPFLLFSRFSIKHPIVKAAELVYATMVDIQGLDPCLWIRLVGTLFSLSL